MLEFNQLAGHFLNDIDFARFIHIKERVNLRQILRRSPHDHHIGEVVGHQTDVATTPRASETDVVPHGVFAGLLRFRRTRINYRHDLVRELLDVLGGQLVDLHLKTHARIVVELANPRFNSVDLVAGAFYDQSVATRGSHHCHHTGCFQHGFRFVTATLRVLAAFRLRDRTRSRRSGQHRVDRQRHFICRRLDQRNAAHNIIVALTFLHFRDQRLEIVNQQTRTRIHNAIGSRVSRQ